MKLSAGDVSNIEEADKLTQFMTDEEYLFCEDYLKCWSIIKAMSKVDMYESKPGKKGKAMYARQIVQKYIDLRRAELNRVFITVDDLTMQVMDVVEKCKTPVLLYDKKGHPTGESVFNAVGAIKGLEMLFKYKSMLEGKGENKAPQPNVTLNVSGDDLDKFMDKFNAEY